VLVRGTAGGIGIMTVQLAARGGASAVAVTTSSAERGDRLRKLGATHVLDRTGEGDQDAPAGYDVIIDIVAGAAQHAAAVPAGRARAGTGTVRHQAPVGDRLRPRPAARRWRVPLPAPRWCGAARLVQADRPVRDTDIVVWHTFVAHHAVRPEDWPVMPVTTAGFHLRPFGYFDAHPALDLPCPHAEHCHDRPAEAPEHGGAHD
jgi:NAD(P)-dependent dehydrogenase (short-subunit alcohol dehydrogenase family)